MIRVIPVNDSGLWECEFDNTKITIKEKDCGIYRVSILTQFPHGGGCGFVSKRRGLSDLIEQINIYLKRLNGDKVLVVI